MLTNHSTWTGAIKPRQPVNSNVIRQTRNPKMLRRPQSNQGGRCPKYQAVKGGMRPIGHGTDKAVLERVEVRVVHVCRKIRIINERCPDRMQMIRQQHPSIDGERVCIRRVSMLTLTSVQRLGILVMP